MKEQQKRFKEWENKYPDDEPENIHLTEKGVIYSCTG